MHIDNAKMHQKNVVYGPFLNVYGKITILTNTEKIWRYILLFEQLKDEDLLTHTEKNIASFILSNTKIVLDMSLEQLSKHCHVSQATIIRLCKKLGTDGFLDFKVKLSSQLTNFAMENEKTFTTDLPIPEGSTTEDITDIFYSVSQNAIKKEYKSLDIDSLKKAAKLINDFHMIHIYGRGESLVVAQDFHYKLIRLGFNSILEASHGFQEAKSVIKNDNDIKKVAIVISQYSNSHQFRYVIDEIIANDIPFIYLTTAKNTKPYSNFAEVMLKVSSAESRYKMGSFASRDAMLYILDCLFGEVFNLDYFENKKRLFKSSKRKEEREYFYDHES